MSDLNQQYKNSYFKLTREEHEKIAQSAVQKAIEKMHSQGVATVEVDKDGKQHLRHPDGRLTPINYKYNSSYNAQYSPTNRN